MERKNIRVPLNTESIKMLRAGDRVLLSGEIYTARDAAHAKLMDILLKKEPLPIPSGSCIYYTGPCPSKNGEIIGPCGPTTSARMDPYTPQLVKYGITGFIGKGARSQTVNDSMQGSAIYFVVTGGAAVLISHAVKQCEMVAFPELDSEAVRRLTIADMPAIVATDAVGNSIF
ncbi:MAG: fumarate hydratase C-terminal domain-containing protein [Clostridia bacterium]|nr:fumarate hydratase C-terminal domain-containing protein [Clostridia bacterium]